MSKMDALRAMREARYAENAARANTATPAKATGATSAPTTKKTTAKKAAVKKSSAPKVSEPVETATEELCGHRNMSGRTCTREHGHAAKSHRYS